MDCLRSTTDMPRRKGAHLTFAERVIIQTRRKDKWSLRRIARELGCAVNTVRNEVRRGNVLLYNGKVELTTGLLGKIRSIDLPLLVRRKNKKKHTREREKKLGRSIEERDPSIEERQEFGHLECDLVLGARSKDEVLLTLVERKTRRAILRKLRNKESATVLEAFRKLRQEEMFKDCSDQVFRTLTTDNGSEFARLLELEETNAVRVYYAHPYCSCEKETNENHNGLLRRFLPKGKRMEDYPAGHIARVEEWANTLPRKILGYSAPEECFEKELQAIRAA